MGKIEPIQEPPIKHNGKNRNPQNQWRQTVFVSLLKAAALSKGPLDSSEYLRTWYATHQ